MLTIDSEKNKQSVILYVSLASILFSIFTSCSNDSSRILHSEEFNRSKLPGDMFIEGSQKVKVENGRLIVDAIQQVQGDIGMCTIWLNKEFSGDLKVEFDACVLSSPGDKNNINFFFLFSDSSEKSLLETTGDRKNANYKKYHKLDGYVFTYLANGNPDTARFRLRDDRGFHVLQENFDYECRQNKIYRIAVTKIGNKLTYSVDGKTFLDCIDDKYNDVHNKGLIGFRTWKTKLWWDNIKVSQL